MLIRPLGQLFIADDSEDVLVLRASTEISRSALRRKGRSEQVHFWGSAPRKNDDASTIRLADRG
jgi:hypothetical protein